MDDFDLIIDELGGEDTEEKTWMCEDCNLEDIDSDETKCPRCGFRHKNHHGRSELEDEYDDEGNPIDRKHFEEHY
jgi:uncharacterized paraquat-inducible protein A